MNAATTRTIERIRSMYLTSDADDALTGFLDAIVENAGIVGPTGRMAEGAVYVLVGAPGSGKSTVVEKVVGRHPGIANGDTRGHFVCEVPSPAPLKQFGRATLHALDYPLVADLREHLTIERLRSQIMLQRPIVGLFDEIQRGWRDANVTQRQRVAATLTSLVQIGGDPSDTSDRHGRRHRTSVILVGTPDALNFVAEHEPLARRVRDIHSIEPFTLPDDLPKVRGIVVAFAKTADLDAKPLLHSDAIGRLCHAARYQRGRAMDLVRQAVIAALMDGRTSVELSDVADAYGRTAPQGDGNRIFASEDWRDVDVSREFGIGPNR